jgi:hypothetical protein
MIIEDDVNRLTENLQLTDDSSHMDFGNVVLDIDVRRYDIVANLRHTNGYIVSGVIRTYIPNPSSQKNGFSFHQNFGVKSDYGFENYPALLTLSSSINAEYALTWDNLNLQDYFPRTLNSEISSSTSTSSNASKSTTNSHTSGSSTSTANTFGINASISGERSVGMQGTMPTASASLGGSFGIHASKTTEMGFHHSHTRTNDIGVQVGSNNSYSMSIKDWSSYGSVAQQGARVDWVWGQTYPWDVIQFNQRETDGSIKIPNYTKERLIVDGVLTPPSQLALHGLDFVNSSKWEIRLDQIKSIDDFKIYLNLEVGCLFAKHELIDSTNVKASLLDKQLCSVKSQVFDVCEVGLSYIAVASSNNGAVIGLDSDKPIYVSDNKTCGRVISSANNLLLDWSGFEDGMLTTFCEKENPKITLKFKIIDTTQQYSLVLLHWVKDAKKPCNLKIKINGFHEIIETINNTERHGGKNNRTEIFLRITDFENANYHDYLVLGLNTVEIEINPDNPAQADAYKLFAVAVV